MNAKKIAIAGGVVLLLFILNDPVDAGQAGNGLFDWLENAGTSISTFLSGVFK